MSIIHIQLKLKPKQYTTKGNAGGIQIRCNNPACLYEWRYTGHFFFYATCPSCRRNIRISQNRIEMLQSDRVRGQSQTAAAVVKSTAAQPHKEMADAQ